jgi:hypothetical protein
MCSNRQSLYLKSKYKIYLAVICTGKHSSIFPSVCSTNNHWDKYHVRSLIAPFKKSPTILLNFSNPTVQSSNNIQIQSGLTTIHPYAYLSIYLPTTYIWNTQLRIFLFIQPLFLLSIYRRIHPSIYSSIHLSTFPYVNSTQASSHSFIHLIIHPSTLNPPIRPSDHPAASSKYLEMGKWTLRDR